MSAPVSFDGEKTPFVYKEESIKFPPPDVLKAAVIKHRPQGNVIQTPSPLQKLFPYLSEILTVYGVDPSSAEVSSVKLIDSDELNLDVKKPSNGHGRADYTLFSLRSDGVYLRINGKEIKLGDDPILNTE